MDKYIVDDVIKYIDKDNNGIYVKNILYINDNNYLDILNTKIDNNRYTHIIINGYFHFECDRNCLGGFMGIDSPVVRACFQNAFVHLLRRVDKANLKTRPSETAALFKAFPKELRPP